MTTIKIDVRDGQVTCGTNGGHVRVPHNSVITWQSTGEDKKFELDFVQLGFEPGDPAAKLDHWPFQEPPPAAPTNSFTGTLKKLAGTGVAPVYKYNVRVGKLLLDPIIIVDE